MKIKIKRIVKRGRTRFLVDLRTAGAGRYFFATESDAVRFVAEKKAELNLPERVVMSERERREYLLAREILAGKMSLSEAAAMAMKITGGVINEMASERALADCISAKRKANCRKSYLQKLESHVNILLTGREKENVSVFTAADVESVLDNSDWSSAWTKRSVYIDLKTFFGFCMKRGWCGGNPCDGVEAIMVDEPAKGILTPAQARIFLGTIAEMDAELMRYFVDQLFGGLRECEARALGVEDERSLHLELPRTKTRNPGFVDFNETWLAWRNGFDKVYWNVAFYNLWQRIAKVKREAKLRMVQEKVASADWWFPKDGLRHSFCSYAAKFWSPGRAAELARHSEATQKKHYRRPVPMEVAKEFWALKPPLPHRMAEREKESGRLRTNGP